MIYAATVDISVSCEGFTMPRHSASHVTENMNNFPFEELEKYGDMWVAWTPDGTRIIAGADDIPALEPAVKAAGFEMSEVVFDYVMPFDVAFMGGAG
jgi:hypothetical protein